MINGGRNVYDQCNRHDRRVKEYRGPKDGSTAMKVLIAEDDPTGNLLLKSMVFRWGFDTVTVFDGAEAWKRLQEEDAPQIVILDWVMPGMDGLEVCRRIREREKGKDRYTYIIMLTGKGNMEDIVTGIDAGVDDYIVKPFNNEELRARLRTSQRNIELHMALRAANKRLQIMSRLDPLTGALSRSAILDDLDLAMYRSRREKKALTIALIDIDDLKKMNERHGRSAGDKILQECIRRISACLRRADNVGRYGGDEFLVILPGVNSRTGMKICHRIKSVIGKKEITISDHSIPVTVSQSIAVWDGDANIEKLITAAEQTLLATKSNGCNRVEIQDLL